MLFRFFKTQFRHLRMLFTMESISYILYIWFFFCSVTHTVVKMTQLYTCLFWTLYEWMFSLDRFQANILNEKTQSMNGCSFLYIYICLFYWLLIVFFHSIYLLETCLNWTSIHNCCVYFIEDHNLTHTI
jgi:hypothetical protein